MMIGYVILALLLLFILTLVWRALLFRPPVRASVSSTPAYLDEEAATARMQAMIRCKTVSYQHKEREDEAAFEAFPALIADLYPKLNAACGQTQLGNRGLLYHWRGKSNTAPTVLMAHYDVVPADPAQWQRPPFDAVIEDNVLWGRGTLDTKCTLFGIMEAAEQLISDGFVPEQDLYLAFGGDEETYGTGAQSIVAQLKANNVRPALVLDEGGAIVQNVFPGVAQPCALVGIAEKGQVNVTFQATGHGGHASAPPPHTLVGALAQAIARVERKPFPFRLTPPALALFDTLGRHASFPFKIIFANLWCFAPLLNLLCKKTGGELNALVRTTCAFTQMQASDAPNVLPPQASVVANLRLIGGDSISTVEARLTKTVAGLNVNVKAATGKEPSMISKCNGEPWQRLSQAIAQTWPDTLLSPYLMLAASDSYYYTSICDCVYRFCPMPLSSEERRLIHGNDERIALDKLFTIVKFYTRLIQAC